MEGGKEEGRKGRRKKERRKKEGDQYFTIYLVLIKV